MPGLGLRQGQRSASVCGQTSIVIQGKRRRAGCGASRQCFPTHLPAGDGGLIGRQHGQKSGVTDAAHRFAPTPRSNAKIFERERGRGRTPSAAQLHQHTVAIEENGAAHHCS